MLPSDRRSALGFLMAGGGGLLVPRPAAASDLPFREAMPVLTMNEGVWEGTYRSLSPRGELRRQWQFRIEITLSDDPAQAYRQDTAYMFDDGTGRDMTFTAQFAMNRIVWGDDRISGAMWETGPETLVAEMRFASSPDAVIDGLVRMAPDGSARSRVEMRSVAGVLDSLTLVDEKRTA